MTQMVSFTFIAMQSIPTVSHLFRASAIMSLDPTPSVAMVMYMSPKSIRLAKSPDMRTACPIPSLL